MDRSAVASQLVTGTGLPYGVPLDGPDVKLTSPGGPQLLIHLSGNQLCVHIERSVYRERSSITCEQGQAALGRSRPDERVVDRSA